MLSSKMSMNCIALELRVTPRTIDRRLSFHARAARLYFRRLKLRNLRHVHFDELQSSVISKCLPISIPVAVCHERRLIVAFDVASMPAQHPLDKVSLRKYGVRADDRPEAIERVLKRIQPMMGLNSQITTDKAPRYPEPIARILKGVFHSSDYGRKARSDGQGELKRGGFDPLFTLNHTAAMTRDGIGRMVRKTWGNSKRIERHKAHFWVYAHYHNEVLVPRWAARQARKAARVMRANG